MLNAPNRARRNSTPNSNDITQGFTEIELQLQITKCHTKDIQTQHLNQQITNLISEKRQLTAENLPTLRNQIEMKKQKPDRDEQYQKTQLISDQKSLQLRS